MEVGWRGFLSLRRIGPCTCRVRSSGPDDSTNRCQPRERSDDPMNSIAMGILPCRLVEREARQKGKSVKETEDKRILFVGDTGKHSTHVSESTELAPLLLLAVCSSRYCRFWGKGLATQRHVAAPRLEEIERSERGITIDGRDVLSMSAQTSKDDRQSTPCDKKRSWCI